MRHTGAKMGYVSNMLRELLAREEKTVKELAELVGMSRPSLSQVVNGYAGLSIALALKLETVFGLDARSMLVAQLYEDIQNEVERQAANRA